MQLKCGCQNYIVHQEIGVGTDESKLKIVGGKQ